MPLMQARPYAKSKNYCLKFQEWNGNQKLPIPRLHCGFLRRRLISSRETSFSMQTTLRSNTSEVNIRPDGPTTVIGEKINPTGKKTLAVALRAGEFDYVRELAARQVAAGADVLDLNVCVPGLDEVTVLPEVVKVVASRVNVPLCID